MDDKNKNILKDGLLETSPEFTSKLMQKIDVEEKALTNVLSNYGSLKTSADFTAQVMQKIEQKSPVFVYKPVISRGAWVGVAAIVAVIFVLAFIFPESGSSKLGISESLDNAKNAIQSFFTFNGVYLYVLVGAFIASVAFLIEQRFSRQ